MNRQRNPRARQGRDHPASNSGVPTIQQVSPGANVSIVLKADQRTGREVQGVVQDLLTRGDHPRGIKVRLQDGRIGRVQRMAGNAAQAIGTPATETLHMSRDQQVLRGTSRDDFPELPRRTLADFTPAPEREASLMGRNADSPTFITANATCPICGQFEGDEAAVSHHIEEHLKCTLGLPFTVAHFTGVLPTQYTGGLDRHATQIASKVGGDGERSRTCGTQNGLHSSNSLHQLYGYLLPGTDGCGPQHYVQLILTSRRIYKEVSSPFHESGTFKLRLVWANLGFGFLSVLLLGKLCTFEDIEASHVFLPMTRIKRLHLAIEVPSTQTHLVCEVHDALVLLVRQLRDGNRLESVDVDVPTINTSFNGKSSPHELNSVISLREARIEQHFQSFNRYQDALTVTLQYAEIWTKRGTGSSAKRARCNEVSRSRQGA